MHVDKSPRFFVVEITKERMVGVSSQSWMCFCTSNIATFTPQIEVSRDGGAMRSASVDWHMLMGPQRAVPVARRTPAWLPSGSLAQCGRGCRGAAAAGGGQGARLAQPERGEARSERARAASALGRVLGDIH